MKTLAFIILISCTFNLFAQAENDSLPSIKVSFKNWDKPFLTAKDFENGSELIATYCDTIELKITSYSIATVVNGFELEAKSNSNKFDNKVLELFKKANHGKNVLFENIKVKISNSDTLFADPFLLKKYDDEFSPFAIAALSNDIFLNDFNTFKTDIRIQLNGKEKDKYKKIVEDFINEIRPLIKTVDIKLVENSPNLILEINESNNLYDTETFNYEELNNLFFPLLKTLNQNITLPNYQKTEYKNMKIRSVIFHSLAEFNGSTPKNFYKKWNNTLTFGLKHDTIPEFTEFDKKLLSRLYSSDGMKELKRITGVNQVKIADNIFLIIIISIIIFIIFSELNSKYHFLFFIDKIKIKLVRGLIFSFLIVQIPLLLFWIFNVSQYEFFIETFEKFYLFSCVFASILSILMYVIENITKKINTLGINLLADTILTITAFLVSYQIVLFFESPELLKIGMLKLNWLYLPLTIVGFNFYQKYSQKRLNILLREKELEISRQKEVVLKSELLSMQSKINPHFLYNALNSIASLAHISASKTEEMTLSLSKLFRYNINKSGELFSTVDKEIEMVKIYLDVELVRFSDRLKYSIETDENSSTLKIPAFVLQPLVENSIKHGISKLTENGIIKIVAKAENNWLILAVYDNGPDFPADIKSNYGLQSIFDKLSLIYKDDFEIIFNNGTEKNVTIRIKL